MKRTIFAIALTALTIHVCSAAISAPSTGSIAGAPASIEELRDSKLKRLATRDPRATDLMPKVEAKLALMEKENAASPLLKRLRTAVEEILMGGGSLGDAKTRADVDVLEAIARDHKEPSDAELAPLKDRYKKVCEQFDDMVFTKDLDRAFKIHDKLVRYTALGLWDAAKIGSEIERLENLVANAPDIAFGSSELLSTYKSKKLASIPKLVYVGSFPQEEIYLAGERRSDALISTTGGSVSLETADFVIQDNDGKLVDLTESSIAGRQIPFSPPLSLWMKGKVLSGRIPAVSLRLADKSVKSAYSVNDVAAGKLDEYLKKNLSALGSAKVPMLIGFLTDFDRAAGDSFGEDGSTPYYLLMDPKLKELDAGGLADELKKRMEKGAFANAKNIAPELCNKYGDAQVPDGPERVRDAWKRVKKSLSESGDTLSFYSTAGSFFGNKNAYKLTGNTATGNQVWNKLDYYWPGENVFDWIGINAVGSDPESDTKGPNLLESISPFMEQIRTTGWQSTPVMLRGLAPSADRTPLSEASWITTVFQKIIPATFPNISLVFVSIPDNLTLWSPDSMSSFRTSVSSNKFYKWPLRFKNLSTTSSVSPPAAQ
jgi:hypothetical protein